MDQKLCLVFEFLDVDLKHYMEAGNSQGTPLTLDLCQVHIIQSLAYPKLSLTRLPLGSLSDISIWPSTDLPSPTFTSVASPWPTGNAEQPDHDHEHENDPYVSSNETDKENHAVGPAPAPTHGACVLFNDIPSA